VVGGEGEEGGGEEEGGEDGYGWVDR